MITGLAITLSDAWASDELEIINNISEVNPKKPKPTLIKQGREGELSALYVHSGYMISGIPDDQWFDRQVNMITRVSPSITTVIIPVNPGDPYGSMNANTASKALNRRSIKSLVVELGASPYALSPVSRVIDQADAILLPPIDSLTTERWMKLWLELSLQQKTPLFGAWRECQINQGFLGGAVITEAEYSKLIDQARAFFSKYGYLPTPSSLIGKTTPMFNRRLLPYYSLQIKTDS